MGRLEATIRRPGLAGAPPQAELYRINRRIRVPEIRVIADDGTQLGILPTADALQRAEAAGLDLVEISPRAVPPVCRIMDFGKFKFEETKKTRQAKRRQTVITIKEIKLRPKTGVHDYEFKLAHIRRFLQEGNKVRLIVQFRGREIVHPQTGRTMLERVTKDTADIGQSEAMPAMDGRRMVMVVAPSAATLAKAHAAPAPQPAASAPPAAPASGAPASGAPASGAAAPSRDSTGNRPANP
ncbi:MAG TPA: translation initiation factor IF-3 [Polyangia bacterium]